MRELEDAEHQQEIDADSGERPGPCPGMCIERNGQSAERNRNRERQSEREPAAPMPAQAAKRVGQPQVLGLCQRHGTVHQGRDRGSDENREEEGRAHRDARERDEHDPCAQRRVQDDEPPRLVVEVRRCNAQRAPKRHPFTPEAATPATK